MNTTMRLLSILFVCLVQSALAQTPAYDALYLNVPLNNVHRTLPVAINDMGDVIGNVRNGEYVGEDVEIVYRGYYYNRASGTYTLAPAVNETKDVVGLQFTPYSNDGRPVLWPAGGSPIDLNSQVVLAAANRKLTAAVDINNLGEILALEDRPGRNSYKVRTVILMPR